MLISEEYRQELLEYFPEIFKKDLYYELTKQVTQCFVEGKDPFPELMTNENVETINNSLKWKLSLSVLKRIDTVTTYWSSSLNINRTLLLLEHPIISEQVKLDRWLWKEKFNFFPTRQIPDCPEIQSPLFGHGKVQLKSDAVLHRLARFTDCINSDKQRKRVNIGRPQLKNDKSLVRIPAQQNLNLKTPFLPQAHINSFQSTFNQGRLVSKLKETCELDYLRFKF